MYSFSTSAKRITMLRDNGGNWEGEVVCNGRSHTVKGGGDPATLLLLLSGAALAAHEGEEIRVDRRLYTREEAEELFERLHDFLQK